MLAKPRELLDRDAEWRSLARFVERHQRLAVVYGPRRVGKSYLLDGLCSAVEGYRYQAITGIAAAQVSDFGQMLGDRLGVGALQLRGWSDAFERLARLELPLLVIDELPYLTEAAAELASVLQRYVDGDAGPPLVLAGSALSAMSDLVAARAPLYGRAAAVVVPAPFRGEDLAELWGLDDPTAALWVDAAVGGLPGYRPLLVPPNGDPDEWMIEEVLAPSSPLLDAAEATLGEMAPGGGRGFYRSILGAIAQGERVFSSIARAVGQPTGALSRPLGALERAGLVVRVPDPLRDRRDTYDLADSHLRAWLSIIAPHRSRLQAGRAHEVWNAVRDTTWRDQVLGPRWEAVVREHVALAPMSPLGRVDGVGETSVPDRIERKSHRVDVVAMCGRKVAALGEAKLRQLGERDLQRLRRLRDLLGAGEAKLLLASATGVDERVAAQSDVVTMTPADVYGGD